MKVRWTARSVRVRLDDLELNALRQGQPLISQLGWPGGGWALELLPEGSGVIGEAGTLRVGLRDVLEELTRFDSEGVTLPGSPRIDIQKDYLPTHLVTT